LKNREIHRLLAGTFVLIMVVSMVFPAYAADIDRDTMKPGEVVTLAETSSGVMPSSHDGIIYQNGNNPVPGSGIFIDSTFVADDFVLVGDFVVTDAHFTVLVLRPPPIILEPLAYFILADDGGSPGNVISSGLAQNIQLMELEPSRFEVWFDFEEGVPLDGGVTYWFALTFMPDTFDIEDPQPIWERSDVITGTASWRAFSLPPTVWAPNEIDMWFQLTADTIVVGGEFIGVDTTTLLLAGTYSTAAWIIPVIVSAIGIGIVIARKF